MERLIFHPCGNFKQTYEEELTLFETDFGRMWVIVGLALLFGVVPALSSTYTLYILNHIAIATSAWSTLTWSRFSREAIATMFARTFCEVCTVNVDAIEFARPGTLPKAARMIEDRRNWK